MVATSAALLAHHAFACWHGDLRLRRKYGEVCVCVRVCVCVSTRARRTRLHAGTATRACAASTARCVCAACECVSVRVCAHVWCECLRVCTRVMLGAGGVVRAPRPAARRVHTTGRPASKPPPKHTQITQAFDAVAARTSTLPFAAILDGRQVLPRDYWREWARPPYAIIAVVTLGAYLAHPLMQSASHSLGW